MRSRTTEHSAKWDSRLPVPSSIDRAADFRRKRGGVPYWPLPSRKSLRWQPGRLARPVAKESLRVRQTPRAHLRLGSHRSRWRRYLQSPSLAGLHPRDERHSLPLSHHTVETNAVTTWHRSTQCRTKAHDPRCARSIPMTPKPSTSTSITSTAARAVSGFRATNPRVISPITPITAIFISTDSTIYVAIAQCRRLGWCRGDPAQSSGHLSRRRSNCGRRPVRFPLRFRVLFALPGFWTESNHSWPPPARQGIRRPRPIESCIHRSGRRSRESRRPCRDRAPCAIPSSGSRSHSAAHRRR